MSILLIDFDVIGKRESIALQKDCLASPSPGPQSSPGRSPLLAPQIYVQPRNRKISNKIGIGIPRSQSKMYPIAPFSFSLLMNFIFPFLINSDATRKVSVSLVQGLVCASFKSCVLSGSPQSSTKIDNCHRL